MQIGGFVDSDSYEDVLRKASNGLGLPEPSEELVVSGGLVPDTEGWTLGEYIQSCGGSSSRSKKLFGVHVESDGEEEFPTEKKRKSKVKIVSANIIESICSS